MSISAAYAPSMFDEVEPAEHDHGVGEHEDVARRHEGYVQVQVGQ